MSEIVASQEFRLLAGLLLSALGVYVGLALAHPVVPPTDEQPTVTTNVQVRAMRFSGNP